MSLTQSYYQKGFSDGRAALLNTLEDLEIAKNQLEKEKGKAEQMVQDLSKFKLAVENAYDRITFADPEGVIIYTNKATEKITGFPPNEVIGKRAGELWGNLMPLTFYSNLIKTIINDKKAFVGEMLNQKKNGQKYTSLLSISPVLDEEEKTLFFVALERDITREKEIDRTKTEIVSLTSHQLLTPLSIVSWYVEMLLAGDAGEINPEQKQYLNEIYTGNSGMIDLVNSLLGVSSMELGTFITNPVATDLTKLIMNVCDEQKLKIQEKDIDLNFELEKDIPLIQADPKYLHMAIQNLLSNAVKYTPNFGKIDISLSLEKSNDGTDAILIKVTDTGIGIPKKEEDKIFTKLFRAQNVLEKDNLQGNGLGLYIVKSIVEHSGGKVWFESIENVGSTFFVQLKI